MFHDINDWIASSITVVAVVAYAVVFNQSIRARIQHLMNKLFH